MAPSCDRGRRMVAAFAPLAPLGGLLPKAACRRRGVCGDSFVSFFGPDDWRHSVVGNRPRVGAAGAPVRRVVPPPHCAPVPTPTPSTPIPTMSVSGDRLEAALAAKFATAGDISRVTASFRAVRTGDTLHINAGRPNEQRAESHLVGLDAIPFHEGALRESAHPWAAGLEAHWTDVREELAAALAADQLEWAAACREEATAYGPEWSTLVLQDRTWHAGNVARFPKTVALLTGGLDGVPPVPTVEVFFARQAPGSGIAAHTDGCNFILTSHLALMAEPDKAYIDVGGERRFWEEGKVMVFDTSYVHSTMNTSEDSRYVLLLRLWHPGVTEVEREALGWIFAALEDPALVDEVLGPVGLPPVVGGVGQAPLAVAASSGGLAGERLPRAERRRQERARRKAEGRGGGGAGLAPAVDGWWGYGGRGDCGTVGGHTWSTGGVTTHGRPVGALPMVDRRGHYAWPTWREVGRGSTARCLDQTSTRHGQTMCVRTGFDCNGAIAAQPPQPPPPPKYVERPHAPHLDSTS